jgi:hypothetical protein
MKVVLFYIRWLIINGFHSGLKESHTLFKEQYDHHLVIDGFISFHHTVSYFVIVSLSIISIK